MEWGPSPKVITSPALRFDLGLGLTKWGLGHWLGGTGRHFAMYCKAQVFMWEVELSDNKARTRGACTEKCNRRQERTMSQ
eukprot:168474-Pyramimonas_sp.AAC.1